MDLDPEAADDMNRDIAFVDSSFPLSSGGILAAIHSIPPLGPVINKRKDTLGCQL